MNSHAHNRHKGSVMVEMAGAVVLLVFLVFGITELGRALYQLNMLTKAVATGARYLARVPDIVSSPHNHPSCAGVSGVWGPAVVRAQNMVVYGNEAGEGPRVLPNMTVDTVVFTLSARDIDERGRVCDPSDVNQHCDCVVSVTAQAPFLSIFGDSIYPDFFGGASNNSALTLTAEAEERFLRIYYAPANP